MTKIAEANKQQQVYGCYLNGMTPETAAQSLKLSYKYVKNKYEDFTIHSATLRGNDKKERIAQIYAIERELFSIMEMNPKDSRIDHYLQIYKTFVV
jgi:NDP-sugar pyrophosphorylase family protein